MDRMLSVCVGTVAIFAGLYGLYVVKQALGIDVFRDGGLHLRTPVRFGAWRRKKRK